MISATGSFVVSWLFYWLQQHLCWVASFAKNLKFFDDPLYNLKAATREYAYLCIEEQEILVLVNEAGSVFVVP